MFPGKKISPGIKWSAHAFEATFICLCKFTTFFDCYNRHTFTQIVTPPTVLQVLKIGKLSTIKDLTFETAKGTAY